MKKLHKFILVWIISFMLIFSRQPFYDVHAETEDERMQRLQQQIQQYEQELTRLRSQAGSLANQVAQYDAQIKLTALKIAETEGKIFLLSGRINQLESSLNTLSDAFASRVVQTYKLSRLGQPYTLIFAKDPAVTVASFQYLKRIEESDRDLLVRLEDAQVTYQDQKGDQEQLQQSLQDQKAVLGVQKTAKAQLLEQTKNDEKKYQQLLAQAKSEYEAIQAIVAGKGDETQVSHVDKGSKIASIIQGSSCNSSGSHLHFLVRQNNTTLNPFNYLRSGINFNNCSGSSCGSSDGDPFNPSGSWDWPIADPIKFAQGYGNTWAVRNTWAGRIYSFHNGIDINSDNPEVKAVQSGILYRGSYNGVNGCKLRYVRLDHDGSDLETFYLHINYCNFHADFSINLLFPIH